MRGAANAGRVRLRAAGALVFALAAMPLVGLANDGRTLSPGDPAFWPKVNAFEKTVAADPENLEAGAEYRQLMIAGSQFDRSIEFFEKLAKGRTPGADLDLNLALAYIDKIPGVNDIKRARLGFRRD